MSKKEKKKKMSEQCPPIISSEAKSFPTFKFSKSLLLDPPHYHTPHHKNITQINFFYLSQNQNPSTLILLINAW